MIKPLKRGFEMETHLKTLVCLIFAAILVGLLPLFESKSRDACLVEFLVLEDSDNLVTIEGNSLLPISNPVNLTVENPRKIRVVVTAYSSTPWETDEDPYITAAGTWVRDGIIANNYLPLGTKVRIPELYGDKVFVVEDRMSWKKGNYHIDIWFPSYWEAKSFGAKTTYIEILES